MTNTHRVATQGGNLTFWRTALGRPGGAFLGNIPNGTPVRMLEIGDPYALIEYNGRQGYAASSFLTPTEEHLASQAQADAQAQAAATQAQASNHDFFPSMWSGGLGTTGEATYRGYPVKIIDHSFVYVPIIDAGDMTREELIEARDKLAVLGPHPDQLRVSIAQGGARSQLNRLVLIGVAFAAGLAIARVLK